MKPLSVLVVRDSDQKTQEPNIADVRAALCDAKTELDARNRVELCQRAVAKTLRGSNPIDQVLTEAVGLIPSGLRDPSSARVRVRLGAFVRSSEPFEETPWQASSEIVVAGRVRGSVDVYYSEPTPQHEAGNARQFELELVETIAERIGHAVERASAEARVQHLKTVLRTVRSVSQLAAHGSDPARLIEQACCDLVATRGLHLAWVHLNASVPGGARTIGCGWNDTFRQLAEALQLGQLPACYQRALRSRKVVAIPEPQHACADCPLAAEYAVGARQGQEALGAVLSADGKDYGFVCITLTPDLVTDDDKEPLVAELADDIAYTLRAIDIEAERVRATEELTKVVLRHQILMNASKEGIAIINQDHRVIEANDAFGARLGYTPEESLKLHTWDWDAAMNEAEVRAAFSDLTKTSATFETRHRHKNGTLIPTEVSAHGALVGGEPLVFTVSRDLTEKKNIQAALLQSDRLATLGMLAAGVAHEINNPLAYVLSNLESLTTDIPRVGEALEVGQQCLESHLGVDAATKILRGDSEFPPFFDYADLRTRFEDTLSGARRIRAIARSLSTFARVEREELVPVDVHHTLECAVTMAFNEIRYRARLTKEYGRLGTVLASEGCLSQVFLNLLINAAHAIDEGDVANNEIVIRTWQAGQEACIEVRDTGHGIPKESIDRIFEPFFSTKKAGVGSGLGLAVSRNIIDTYAGRIEVQSEYGRGSSFVVRLPTSSPQPGHLAPVPAGPPHQRARGRVMIIDDDPGIRRSLNRLLRHHELVVVSSGDAAMGILAEDQRFDVILCDVIMPAVSGTELHRWLRERYPDLARKLVFITGGAFAANASAYLATTDNLCLKKPFDAIELTGTVAELIAKCR